VSHVLVTLAAALVAAGLAHRFAGGPGLPSGAYVLPAARAQERPRPWWQLGLQLSSTFGRRWVRTRIRRPRAAAPEALAVEPRRDGTLLLPGRRDAAHAVAATRAALLAAAATVGTLGLQTGSAWQVPPVTALAAIVLGLATVRPGVLVPAAATVVVLPLSGAVAAVTAGVAGAVAVAGTVRRRRAGWARVGTALAVALVAEAAWRLSG
jgi:hypothetical protein